MKFAGWSTLSKGDLSLWRKIYQGRGSRKCCLRKSDSKNLLEESFACCFIFCVYYAFQIDFTSWFLAQFEDVNKNSTLGLLPIRHEVKQIHEQCPSARQRNILTWTKIVPAEHFDRWRSAPNQMKRNCFKFCSLALRKQAVIQSFFKR